jgi:hypothetical protein
VALLIGDGLALAEVTTSALAKVATCGWPSLLGIRTVTSSLAWP